MASWPSPLFDCPMFSWELRRQARKGWHFVFRSAYGITLLLLLWACFRSAYQAGNCPAGWVGSQEFASWFLKAFSLSQLAIVLLLTPAYVGAGVATLAERGLLDDLLTTDLSDREIVLGQWAGRLLSVAALLLAGWPILAMTAFMGGLAVEKATLTLALSLTTLASTATLATMASVYYRNLRETLWTVYGVLILGLLFAPLAAVGLVVVGRLTAMVLGRPWAPVEEFAYLFHPFFLWFACVSDDVAFYRPGERLLRYVAFHGLFVIAGLSWAIRRLRQPKSEPKSLEDPEPWLDFDWLFAERTIGPVSDRPMTWKAWHYENSRRSFVVHPFLAIIAYGFFTAALIGAMMQANDIPRQANLILRYSSWPLLGSLYVLIAIRLASSLTAERERNCWPPLLMTSLTGRDIVVGKLLGSFRPLIIPIVLGGHFWAWALLLGGLSPLALPLILFVVGCHLLFVIGLSVRQSFRCATSLEATLTTLGICIVVGGALQMLLGIWFDPIRDTGNVSLLQCSSPWIELWQVHFPPGTAENRRRVIACLAFAAVYGVIGGGLLLDNILRLVAIASFDRSAGRGADRALFTGRRKS